MHGQTDSPDDDSSRQLPNRRQMIRDVVVFQLKLLADGFRDLLLVPISLGAAVMGLLKPGSKPGPQFYDVLRFGRQSEHWINLFGAASNVHGPESTDERFPGNDVDELVTRVESFLIDEYRSGGVTARAKEKLERTLAAINRRRNRDQNNPP
jgi:hypothetical protein